MTTLWRPDRRWAGHTVSIIARGPSMTRELATWLGQWRTIVVNRALPFAPWADMLVRLDAQWSSECRAFAGMRVTGIEDPALDALYIGHRWERVTVDGGQIEIRSSGLAAVQLAAEMGADRILLGGFEPEASPAYVGVAEGLRAIVAQLQVQGVHVEHVREIPRGER